MKERLRSSQSSNRNEDNLERSQYESPKKASQHAAEGLGEEVQYKLEKVFEEAGNREERYINLIKEQETQLAEQSHRYLQALRDIKKEFLHFMSNASKNDGPSWKALKNQQPFNSKPLQRLNSTQFSLRTLRECSKQEGKVQPELHCKITCYYYTPFAEDCLRFIMPEALTLRLRNFYPGVVMSKDVRVIKEEDEADNINCLLNRVPFQIATQDGHSIAFDFKIPCTLDAINHYRRRELQVELVDQRGLFILAYGKLALRSLLHYEDHPTEWQLKPLPLFSPLDGSKIAELSIKMGNTLVLSDHQQHYKVQSSTPMELNNLKNLVNYNDEESRMIQRISKFKTNTNSLLLGIGATRQARPERIFEQDNDRTILMHRQKKELQSILEYKNSHKSELMDKLFNDAIDRYFLTDCEIATPKFITFTYRNTDKQHRKLFGKIQVSCKGDVRGENTSALLIEEQIQTSLVSPRQMGLLMREELLDMEEQSHQDYEFDEEEQSLWAISGMTHAITVRVLCLPLKPVLATAEALAVHFELKLNLLDEYNQEVESFHTKIRIRQPALENTLHIHGYCEAQSEVEIPLDAEGPVLKKGVFSNILGLEHRWDSNYTNLSLKLSHQSIGERSYYLIINDSENLYNIARYQLILYSYPKLSDPLLIQLGQVSKVSLDFALTEELLTQSYKQIEELASSKGRTGKDHLRVLFASSKPEHCIVTCQNQPEVVCKLTQLYQLDVKIQTFDTVSNPEKILIHAMDLDRKIILKRWLLLLEKESTENYKQVYRLSCEQGKLLRYKFQLMNEDQKQKSLRFYSSNLTIMSVPQSMLSLLSNQRATVELQFNMRKVLSAEEALQPVKVILTVTDGATFNNYLFELNVRVK